MKNRFLSSFAILTLALAGAFSTSAIAQTTDEGSGPSEQPSAPMEMGQGEMAPPPPSSQVYDGQQPQSGDQSVYAQAQPGEEAQPGGPSGEEPAKTNQGVGRISMMHGDVSTQRGDSGDWSAAVLNQPVLGGDKVSTAVGGRAEVQLDFANILRLGPNAQANIANFTHDHIQIQLAQGLADYSVFNESEAEPEIDAPNVAVHPAHKDVIVRVEVRADGDTVVIVRKGEAQISTPKGIAEVKEGEMATVRGSAEEAQYKISLAPDRDDWDRWNSDRDHMIHSAKSWQHTNKYYTGAEDLDANGRWEDEPDYGQVWVPNEPEGWVPYRDGNWVWEPYYGWTWVGYEPWGWAPYHYGRWMMYGSSWAWWPGPVWGGGFYRPFWAPAYVSFFGFGGGWSVGFGWGGWGGFGWLPVGPCDRFFPWWGGYGGRFGVVGFNRFGGLNRFGGFAPLHGGNRFSNLSHINDPHIGRAVSTVGAGHFGAGRVSAVAATHAQLSSAHMMTGNVPVVPTHASLSASGRAAAPSTIHNTASQRFYGSGNNSRTQSFQQQTAHLQQSMQQSHFSPVSAGGRSGAIGTESRSMANVGGGKPSAGTPAAGREMNTGREMNRREMNNGSARAGNSAANSYGGSGNTRSYAPPNSSANRSQSYPQRAIGQAAPTNRGPQASPSTSQASRGWSQFAPPEHSGSGTTAPNGSYWNRTAPSSTYSRGPASSSSAYGRGSASSSRPQLSMRQPVVQPRSSGSNGNSGGYRPSPSYSSPNSSGSRSTPSYGSSPSYGGSRGSYSGSPRSSYGSSPSYGGSRGGYSGGSRSMPSYGGGRGGYSGGSRSTPSYSGGRGYSGGSHSAPSSGGGHSSGGSSSHSSGGGHSSGSSGHSNGHH